MIYNEFRPDNFDDVVGQESNVTILRKQVINNTVPNALLLYGHHGCGKTTLARILAKAINCENPQNGNPCGQCSSCKTIKLGTPDIIEIDAASNNSVESIREMIQKAQYMPVSLKYKVYIIDEVHMLSSAAFNALLKTLEEPPAHTKFFMATTEQYKVPKTIQSRCSKYLFRSLLLDEIEERINYVLKEKNVSMQPDAVRLIARASDGAMRDALSILEQALTSGCTSVQQVQSLVGLFPEEYLFDVVRSYGKRDLHGVMTALAGLSSEQLSDKVITDNIIDICIDRVTYLTVGRDILSMNKTADYIDSISELPLSETECIALLDTLGNSNNLKHSFVSAIARTKILEQPVRIVEEALSKLNSAEIHTMPVSEPATEPNKEDNIVPETPVTTNEELTPDTLDNFETVEAEEDIPFETSHVAMPEPLTENEFEECPFDDEPEECSTPTPVGITNPFAGFHTGFPF